MPNREDADDGCSIALLPEFAFFCHIITGAIALSLFPINRTEIGGNYIGGAINKPFTFRYSKSMKKTTPFNLDCSTYTRGHEYE